MLDVTHSKFKNMLIEWSCQLVVALFYVLFGYITHKYLISHGIVSAVWLGSGVALAALLIGGWRYLWGAFFGMLAFNALVHNSIVGVVGVTLANVLEAILGYWLLSKKGTVSPSALQNYLRLIVLGGGVASIVGGVIGAFTLLLLGFITSADYLKNVLTWWMGDTLGVVLLVPFSLVWYEKKSTRIKGMKWLEGVLLVGASFFVGQIVFLDLYHDFFSNAPKGYLLFLCVSIVAIRMGMRGATLVVLIAATQGMLGAYLKIGFFANEIVISQLRNYWLYILVLSGVGVSLASYVDRVNQTLAQLQTEIVNRIQTELTQKEATDRLQKIAENLPGVVYQFRLNLDGSSCFPYASNLIKDIYHVTPEEVQESAEKVFAILHPDDYEQIVTSITESAKNLTPWIHEYRTRFKDGSENWLLGNALPQREADGSTLWHGFITDISKRKQVEVALQKESDKNLMFLRNASDGIHILNHDGNIVECSDSFCTMLGYNREEMIGMHVSQWDVGIPESELMEVVNAQFKKTTRFQFESQHRRKDGTIYDVELSGCSIEFDGEWVLFNSVRDITERKNTEEKLRASEQRLDEIINLMPIAVFVKDRESRIVLLNNACEKQWGTSISELQHTTGSHIFPPEQMDIFLAADKKIFVDGKSIELEEFIWNAELQENRIIHTYKKPVFNKEGEPDYLIGVSVDITEAKRQEQELLASEARFRTIIDISPVPMALNDDKQNIIFLNQAFVETFGYDLNDIPILEMWWEKAYPDSNYRQWVIETWQATFEQARREQKAFVPFEIKVRCKNDLHKIILASAAMVSEVSDNLHLVILYDITARKQIEQKLAITNADLVQFTNVAAHHLQEPTRRIVSFVQRLKDVLAKLPACNNDDVMIAMQFIEQSAVRQRALVSDIQLYLAATQPRADIESVAVVEVLTNVVKKFALLIQETHAHIEWHELPAVMIDRTRLYDIFNILIENALNYRRLDCPPKIRIYGENCGKRIRYYVEDNGIGIPAEYRERVFLVFERLQVNDNQASTGIGLAIVRRIVESCDGSVSLQETTGGGATVVFDLPAGI